MKKVFAFILSVFLVLSVFSSVVWANAANTVYADAVTIEAGDGFTVPVKIENNEGFMGFSIVVTYDPEVFKPISVSKGAMLDGMLNDSIKPGQYTEFKVIFTGTQDITGDGVLFSIEFEAAQDVSGGEQTIGLSYSQQDTFAEDWSACELSCRDIEVIVTVGGTTLPTTTTEPGGETTTTEPGGETTTTEPGGETTTTEPGGETTTTEPGGETTTTEPGGETTTTEPGSENPGGDPVTEKPLSVRLREWVNGLTKPFNVILGIFVLPIALIISVFE